MLDSIRMKKDCPVCKRPLGVAYHGKKIKKKFKLLTNSSNEINLELEDINENYYIFTDKKITK